MATRRYVRSPLFIFSIFSLATVFSLGIAGARFAMAQGAAPEGENLPQAFEGKLKVAAVVFSGPGTRFYPTTHLKEGQTVVVVAVKNDYLKIQPPEGSFSFIPKAFVDRHGSGDKGKVNHQAVVRAGSELMTLKTAVQTTLEPGDDVTILGEEDEYLKIKPPKGACVYVDKKLVDPIGPVAHNDQTAPAPAQLTPPAADPSAAAGPNEGTSPTTRDTVAAAPSTRPAEAEMLIQLQTLEGQFAEASKQPLSEQPLDDLMASYTKLSSTDGVPDMVKRIADIRISTLKVRTEAKTSFVAMQQQQQEFQQKLIAQQAEKEELEQHLKQIDIQVYAAIGTLRGSSLQVAKTPLYRLTDPQTGRTVVYVWGTDAKLSERIGQFIGIKGSMQTDPRLNLKVINPTTIDQVDPNKVNTSVAAEIVPPSLLPKAPSASTVGP